MANRIKLKRGLSANIGSLQLETGELAVTTDTGELYVGDRNKKVTKINNNTTKVALRKAAEKVIPNDAFKKKKLGFPVPIREWLKEDDIYKLVKEKNPDVSEDDANKIAETIKFQLFHSQHLLF